MKIALDFAPGLHGHFLELVVNKYIYGKEFNGDHIFQNTGAAHGINFDSDYQKNKVVYSGHYSSFRVPYPNGTEQVIFIDHCSELDFVLLTNIYYRCHPDAVSKRDVNVNEIMQMHEQFLLEDRNIDRRNNWFSKLCDSKFEHARIKPSTNFPVYNFDFSSFFHLTDFCNEMKRLSKFLNVTFKFDMSLSELWKEFINCNQGWQLYCQANGLLEDMLLGHNKDIPDDWKLHAYLNYRLSKTFEVDDGQLYTNEQYPKNTFELLDVVVDHVNNFDNRW